MPVLSAFSPELARDRAAADAFAAAELPTAEEEVWRYSPIGDLELGRYRLADAAGDATVPEGARRARPRRGLASVAVVTVNGRIVHRSAPGGSGSERVEVGVPAGPHGIELPESTDAFDSLNAAYSEPIVIRIAAGSAPGPVVVFHWFEGEGIVSLPHVIVDAGADSDVRVVEVLRSAGDTDALVIPVTDLGWARPPGSATSRSRTSAAASGNSATSAPPSMPTPRSPRPRPGWVGPTGASARIAGSSGGAPPAT